MDKRLIQVTRGLIAIIIAAGLFSGISIQQDINNKIISEINTTYGYILKLQVNHNKLLDIVNKLVDGVDNNTKKTNEIFRNNKEVYNLLQRKIEELAEQYKEVDVKHILNGSVFVRGTLGQGAGTVIYKTNKEMYVLTCLHVIDDIVALNEAGLPVKATIGYYKNDNANIEQGKVTYEVDIVKYDREADLALIRVNAVDSSLEVITIAQEQSKKGDVVYSVGNPLNLIRTISKGILANKIEGFYLSENVTTFGNSGGGLYNKEGELIGVSSNVMGYKGGLDKEGKDTFIPESSLGLSRDLETIKIFLEDLNETLQMWK